MGRSHGAAQGLSVQVKDGTVLAMALDKTTGKVAVMAVMVDGVAEGWLPVGATNTRELVPILQVWKDLPHLNPYP